MCVCLCGIEYAFRTRVASGQCSNRATATKTNGTDGRTSDARYLKSGAHHPENVTYIIRANVTRFHVMPETIPIEDNRYLGRSISAKLFAALSGAGMLFFALFYRMHTFEQCVFAFFFLGGILTTSTTVIAEPCFVKRIPMNNRSYLLSGIFVLFFFVSRVHHLSWSFPDLRLSVGWIYFWVSVQCYFFVSRFRTYPCLVSNAGALRMLIEIQSNLKWQTERINQRSVLFKSVSWGPVHLHSCKGAIAFLHKHTLKPLSSLATFMVLLSLQ